VVGDRRIRPHGVEDFLFGHEAAGAFDQKRQQVERFGLERDRCALTLEPEVVEVEHEVVPAVFRGHCIQNTCPRVPKATVRGVIRKSSEIFVPESGPGVVCRPRRSWHGVVLSRAYRFARL
jgi:hypothetical protein